MKANSVSQANRHQQNRFRALFALALLLGGSVAQLNGQDQEPGRTEERVLLFDERGDAKVEYSYELDRASWDRWKRLKGDHPDQMLRKIKDYTPTAVIEDLVLEKDDTHRRAVVRWKARSLGRYRGNNQFDILVSKRLKLVTGAGLEWVFTRSDTEDTPKGGTRIVNITYRAKLPAKAQNAHMVNGNDSNHLVYSLAVSPSRPKTLLYSGLLLILAAIALAVFAVFADRAGRGTRYPPPLPPATGTPTPLPQG